MSATETLQKILQELGRADKFKDILESPQTDITDDDIISIDLSDLALTTVPADLLKGLDKLERFHASFNSIEEIPSGFFANAPNIKFINLYGNNLVALPDDIFDGLSLDWIDLRSNNLERLPKSLGTQDKLSYLYLQNNPLSQHSEYNWAADYHSARDVKKFMPEFQDAMGLEVTTKKPKTREQIAQEELKKRQSKEDN